MLQDPSRTECRKKRRNIWYPPSCEHPPSQQTASIPSGDSIPSTATPCRPQEYWPQVPPPLMLMDMTPVALAATFSPGGRKGCTRSGSMAVMA